MPSGSASKPADREVALNIVGLQCRFFWIVNGWKGEFCYSSTNLKQFLEYMYHEGTTTLLFLQDNIIFFRENR